MATNPLPGWMPDGATLRDVGHVLLDAAGLIPVIGEPADLANAAWLASEGNYLDAGLSLISVVPIVGDAVGKGGKIAKAAGGKLAGKALDAVKAMDFGKVLDPLRANPKIGPYVDRIVEALEGWRKGITQGLPGCGPGGAVPCGAAGAGTKGLGKLGIGELAEGLAKATGDEAVRYAEHLAEMSTHAIGDAERVVLGKWPGYIEEAKRHGGTWFETPADFFDKLKAATGSAEAAAEKAWLVNEAFIRKQLAGGAKLIEVTKEGLKHALDNPNSMMAKELKLLAAEAEKNGFVKSATGWIKGK